MPGTYTLLLVHVVFSTKRREPLIAPEIADRLFAYMGGIVRDVGGSVLAAGGVEDHVHLLLQWRADAALSDLMRVLKAKSSRWVHDTYSAMVGFAWQDGYAAFSVSRSSEPQVRAYIASQREHHAHRSFLDELEELLSRHGVSFERRHIE